MQTTTTSYLAVLLCLHLQLLCSGTILTGRCPPKCICPLSSAVSKQGIHCASNGFHLEIQATHSHLTVYCNDNEQAQKFDDIGWNLRDFISSDVELSQLTLQRCPIPANRSLIELLSPFLAPAEGAVLRTLFLVGNSQNSYTAPLSPKLFEGLSNLNILSLKNATGVPIAANDLLAFVPQLRWLDVREYSHALPPELLKYVPTLTTLEMGHNALLSQAMAAGFLNHLDSINTLIIRSCSLDHLPSLSHLQGLKVVDINTNHAFHLTSSDTFANLTELVNVSLKNNQLKELPYNLFHTNTAIKLIDLSRNRLKELSPDLFRYQTSLEVLRLQSNQLKGELPDMLFSKTKKLNYIDLSENALETINDELFANLRNLRTLVLSSNRIREIHPNAFKISMPPTITELYLAHNNLSFKEPGQGPFYALDELRVLDLSYNAISNANRVQYNFAMRRLEILDLSHNSISNILYADLMFLSKRIRKFSLSANGIQTIHFGEDTNDGRLNLPEEIMLNGNPLRCDIRQFVHFLQNKNAKISVHIGGLKCDDTDDELSNVRVQSVDQNN